MAVMEIPKTRGQYVAQVLENRALCREHFRLVLRVDRFASTGSGQFIQIACREVSDGDFDCRELGCDNAWTLKTHAADILSPRALLRRPFSLAGRRDTPRGVELDIIHRVVGVGTTYLAHLQTGDLVGILGPLGNRFMLPSPGTQAILVCGGVGIPPMIYLAEHLRGCDAVAFCGALSRDLIPLEIISQGHKSLQAEPEMVAREFARCGIPSILCTDDGSFGFTGLVTHALEKYLDRHKGPAIVYTCGPEGMMKRVGQIAAQRGLESQIAVERAMACGMGTCQSCAIRVRRKEGDPANRSGTWAYKLACTDGPVFRGEDLLW